MRNLFDQYDEPENRLTHALACCLSENPKLLRGFIRWTTGVTPPPASRVRVEEQSLPGELEVPETEAEQRGLPDMWIHDDDRWSLIVESKVQAPVKADQIRRHRATAARRGFDNQSILVLSPERPADRSLAGAHHRRWSELYEWLTRHERQSEWARRLIDYMERVEVRLTAEGYMTRGSLTRFAGIKFGPDNPYNYREAKRVLKLAMDELRWKPQLKKIRLDPHAPGRPAITGTESDMVWDILQLDVAKRSRQFIRFPHCTLTIQRQRVLAIVIVPNGMQPRMWRNLRKLNFDAFRSVILDVTRGVERGLRSAEGARPWAEVIQRRYASQRSIPTVDATCEFDPRTALEAEKSSGARKVPVKHQPQWLEAAYELLTNRRSNLQLAIGAQFPYGCKAIADRKALDLFASTWVACKPLLSTLMGK